jgi:hypothetical protein
MNASDQWRFLGAVVLGSLLSFVAACQMRSNNSPNTDLPLQAAGVACAVAVDFHAILTPEFHPILTPPLVQ